MKLSEKIKELPQDMLIAIGARAGFVFMGTVKEWGRLKERINQSALLDKYRVWENKCAEERSAAKLNKREYQEPPEPIHIPYEDREVLDAYNTTVDSKFVIVVEGNELGRSWTLSEWNGKSEEQMKREFIQSMYALKGGEVVRIAPYDDAGYERIREEIVSLRAQSYAWAYEAWLKEPNEKHEGDLMLAESRIKDSTFKTLCAGIEPDSLIKMIQKKARGSRQQEAASSKQ